MSFSIYRLTQKCLARQIELRKLYVPHQWTSSCASKIKIKAETYKKDPNPEKSHDLRNRKIGRLLSPCLSIYKGELHSFMSFCHRTSGMVAAIYCYALGNQAIFLSCDIEYYLSLIEELHLGVGIIVIKFLFVIPFTFHLLNGIRHVMWDMMAKGLSLKEVTSTSTLIIGLALVSAISCFFV